MHESRTFATSLHLGLRSGIGTVVLFISSAIQFAFLSALSSPEFCISRSFPRQIMCNARLNQFGQSAMQNRGGLKLRLAEGIVMRHFP
jgi:hypothetical protein